MKDFGKTFLGFVCFQSDFGGTRTINTWCKHCGVSKFADFCGKNQLLKILRMALHNESQFLFWSFYEDRQHFSKNRTKTSQSETNKTTILKVKGKGWS